MPSSTLVRAVALAVVASGLALAPSTAQAADPLTSDADGAVDVQRDRGGRVFASTRAGDSLDNPRVHPSTSPRSAARAHLDRYGAGLGVDDPTDFAVVATTPLASGGDVVRSQQQADGLPVLGGEVVMVLDADRSLASVQASVVDVPDVAGPKVGRSDAEARALAAVRKHVEDVRVVSARRVVLDPTLFELPAGAATAWEVEVGNGLDVRRHVYVDDRTGGVVRVVDLVQHLDRVVCDAANVPGAGAACTTGFARQEGQPATGQADVDQAYEHAGEVAALYQSAGVDLAAMLSTVEGGARLASTVRFCDPEEPCPWVNAAWNGSQMLYGQGYASADDVVGHEMTHGFVQHTSNLFYFGQPGAINESMADVVGELLDQRQGGDDDSAWHLGEDLPDGALRSMSDPTVAGDPDSTASPLWHADASDAEGVHTNSGVGNKTAYLVSQGGSFGGQAVAGLDAGDPTRAKTLLLYLDTIRSLGSASDYAALGRTLVSACQRLVGTHGFTTGDCTQVQKAVAATRLAKRPAALGEDPSASMTCPDGGRPAIVRDLDDFTTPVPAVWQQVPRDPSFAVPAPGETAWYADDYAAVGQGTVPLITRGVPVTGPRRTYLFLEHWYAFETDAETGAHYDGGIVDTSSPDTLAASRWVNGPDGVLAGSDVVGFAGSSRGWTSSRVDLTGLRPSGSGTVDLALALSADDSGFEQGWYVRQATVYTCPARLAAGTAAVRGTPRVGSRLTAATPRAWGPAPVALSYQWLRGSTPIAGARQRTYVPTARDVGVPLRVRITGTKAGFVTRTVVSGATGRVQGVLAARRPVVKGTAKVGSRLRASVRWTPRSTRSTYRWLRDGRAIKGATRSTYRLVAKDRGRRISVRITGRLKDHVTRTVTSGRTGTVRR